jgi:hypothetical protein
MYARGFPCEARSEYALSISMLSLSTLPPLTALPLTLSRPKLFSQLLRTTLIFKLQLLDDYFSLASEFFLVRILHDMAGLEDSRFDG